jgi:hypothetical protein
MNHSLSAIEGTYRPVNFTLLQVRTCASFKKWGLCSNGTKLRNKH